MHNTAAVRIEIADDAGVPPAATTPDNGAEESPPPRDEPAHPVARRGASHSWFPGAWGDPF
jgi:hypothetical protein